MTQLDLLPPDQRAVLSLVLNQGKSYSEVASMLSIAEETVRERAHAALDALAADATASAAPNGGAAAAPAPATAAVRVGEGAEDPPGKAPEERPSAAHRPGVPRGSRLGGALVLAAIAAVIVVAVLLLSGGGGKGSSSTGSNATSTPSSTGTSTTAAGTPKIDKRLTLSATESGSKASGIGVVLSQGSRRAFYVAAQNLTPSSGFFYAVWLYNSQANAAALGRAPTVSSNGRMEGGGPLPSNAGSYHKLIITRETSPRPTQPGPIVLSGAFALH